MNYLMPIVGVIVDGHAQWVLHDCRTSKLAMEHQVVETPIDHALHDMMLAFANRR